MATRVGLGVVAAALTFAVTACGGTAPKESVFFVSPKDGATISREAKLEFGSEQFTISPVPPGEITEAKVRPGTGHFHVAIDTDCLPAGTVIPMADPWVHFGKGQTSVETALPPGKHTLTVQAGDDQHRTKEGLCQTITVNVE
jgi:hypothetical protein